MIPLEADQIEFRLKDLDFCGQIVLGENGREITVLGFDFTVLEAPI